MAAMPTSAEQPNSLFGRKLSMNFLTAIRIFTIIALIITGISENVSIPWLSTPIEQIAAGAIAGLLGVFIAGVISILN